MLTREFELPMSYTEMAVYLNADRAAMTRELSLLEKEGFIEKKGHKIRLLW
jgi:DNA-binding MarR family transcriptional regulator